MVRLAYLNDLIPWKFQIRDVSGITRHQIPVEDTEYRLVCNEQQIVLFSFEFKNNWLQPHC